MFQLPRLVYHLQCLLLMMCPFLHLLPPHYNVVDASAVEGKRTVVAAEDSCIAVGGAGDAEHECRTYTAVDVVEREDSRTVDAAALDNRIEEDVMDASDEHCYHPLEHNAVDAGGDTCIAGAVVGTCIVAADEHCHRP